MHIARIMTLISACGLLLGAAELELRLPRPQFQAVDQPVLGQVVALELVTAGASQHLAPSADVQLWKDRNESLGRNRGMALRDNGWSVALLRYADEALSRAEQARLHLPMGGVERAGSGRFSVYRMLVPWTEAAHWSHSGHADWQGPRRGQDYAQEPIASLEFEPEDGKRDIVLEGLETLVAAWADGSIPNHGLILRFDGQALQTSVPARENLNDSTSAILGHGGGLEIRWQAGVFDRLLQARDDLRDVSVELEVTVDEQAVGGAIEATAIGSDVVLASVTLETTGSQRYTIRGLAAAAIGPGVSLAWRGPDSVRVLLRGNREQLPQSACSVLDRPAVDLFQDEIPFRDGVHVQVVDGHLHYGGERLRLWGTLGYGSKPRIRAMGFNAYRLWGGPSTQEGGAELQRDHGKRGELPPTTKGDGSKLDRFDREYAECRELGLFVMATFLMRNWIDGAEEPGSFVDDGGDFEHWRAALSDGDWEGRTLAKFMGMVDERFARIHERACSQILDRVNPYTGKRYAEDEVIAIHELANEQKVVKELIEGKLRELPGFFQSRFDQAWMAWLRERYADDAALIAAWGEVAAGESLAAGLRLAPLHQEHQDHPKARAADVVRFLCDAHRAYLDRIRAHCRSHAPEGVGVAVTPFSYDTQYRPNTAWTYVASAADVQNFGMYFWNYGSDLNSPPGMYVMDSTTVAGKPTVIYETNRGRPSPYRAEYPFMLAAFASWQDWDAIFFHYWGGPTEPTSDEQYLLATLDNGHQSHFWTMVHQAEDPVMCAVMATAGRAFLGQQIAPAAEPVTWRVGGQAIFGYDHYHGVSQGPSAFQRGSRLQFEPDGDFAIEQPDDAPATMPDTAIRAGDITWDWPNGRLIVDTPQAKFLVGRSAAHTFADGIAFSGFDLPWAAIALISSDGKALAVDCERALVCATAHAQNTGFEIDLTAKLGGPLNQIDARIDNGEAPVVVDRVGFTIGFPSAVQGELAVHDFARRLRLRKPIDADGAIRLHGEDLFLGVLSFASRGPAREAVVDELRVVVDEAEQRQRRLPSREGYWFPLEGLDWDRSNVQALAVLQQRGSARLDGEHVVLDEGRLLLDAPARIQLSYAWARMSEVAAEILEPPTWEQAEATLRASFGEPSERRLGTQFEGSRAAWQVQRDGGTFLLELSEIQGVMRITIRPPDGG